MVIFRRLTKLAVILNNAWRLSKATRGEAVAGIRVQNNRRDTSYASCMSYTPNIGLVAMSGAYIKGLAS